MRIRKIKEKQKFTGEDMTDEENERKQFQAETRAKIYHKRRAGHIIRHFNKGD